MEKSLSLKIKTKLVGREEIFRVLAVGHATKLPILLVGPPGTGKTNVLLDYMASAFPNETDTFVLEVDEGTRSSEVKGNIDFKELVTNNNFIKNSPITKAKGILINEIDKSTSGLRNAFLGIMNERILFDGNHKIPCEHELFIASCNEIPKDEMGSPFWDRFVMKQKVERVPKSLLMDFLVTDTTKEINIHVPSEEEMQKVKFKDSSLEVYLNTCYQHLTDRSLLHIREIAPAVKYIYGISPDRALVKSTYLIAGKNLAEALAKAIEPAEILNIRNSIQTLSSIKNIADIRTEVEKITKLVKAAVAKSIVEEDILKELEEELSSVLQNHPSYVEALSYTQDVQAVTSEF